MRILSWTAIALAIVVSACSGQTTSPTKTDEPPAAADPKPNAKAGAEAVQKRTCDRCHGENMAGSTKSIPFQDRDDIELYPPNLTPDLETGLGDPDEKDPAKRGYTDALLARAIRRGLDRDDLELCPQMQHFADMTDFEVFSIIAYLRSLPPVHREIPRSVCAPLKTKKDQTK